MTSRELTGLLPLAESAEHRSARAAASDLAWRIGFGAITWPWLLRSLWGGRKADKRALLDALALPHDALPHLGSWKADTGFLRHIVEQIARLRPANVVELGAGASTLVAAKALALHGGGRLTSFDQHAGFVEATNTWLNDHGLSVDLRHAPLEAGETDWPGRWYRIDRLPETIDLIIIDGPPWAVHPLVRGGAETLFSRLRPGGVILLDDAARPGERLVTHRWARSWPGIDFHLATDGTKGTLVGIKRAGGLSRPAANDNGRMLRQLGRAACLCALIAAGWVARDTLGEAPLQAQSTAFVEEAAASHRTSLLREAMRSQIESPKIDAVEIGRSTGITLPVLPTGWHVRDVQIYPSSGAPAVAVSLTTPRGETVSLFADKAETPAEAIPMIANDAGENVAYWEVGDAAFALTGTLTPARTMELASAVATRGT